MKYSEILSDKMTKIMQESFITITDTLIQEIYTQAKEYEDYLNIHDRVLSTEIKTVMDSQCRDNPDRKVFILAASELTGWLTIFRAYDTIRD